MLTELKTKHREIARLNFEGFTPADIAQKTNISTQTIYKILKNPICQAYVNGLGDQVDKTTLDVRERLMQLNAKALDAFDDILSVDSKAPYSVQATVGKDILDRTGHKPPKEVDLNLTLQGKSDDEIDAQIEALKNQLNAAYNADLTNDPDDTEDITDSDDDTDSDENSINPITDSKES